MKMLKILSIVSFWLISAIDAQLVENSIDFYERTITTNLEDAQTFQLPTNSYSFKQNYSSDKVVEFGTFDFIIIGGGSAGCVLASRLSEIDNWKILLLEAGKNETKYSNIPAMGPTLQLNEFNWGYQSVPQSTSCLAYIGRRCPIPRGKVLGGSSGINSMAYSRGNRLDYDNWKKLGNDGWSYKDVLPYFLKSENSSINGDPGFQNVGGLLNVQYASPESPLMEAFIVGSEEIGQREVDYNGRQQIGVARLQRTIIDGQRDSSNRAFLNLARGRKNLQIVTSALVLKILIASKSAYGAQFILNGQLYETKARKEVILSAGAINSPHLLMLSGIGPAKHLEEKGIKVTNNLEGVGQNLQDHVMFTGFRVVGNYSEPIRPLREHISDYLNGLGELTFFQNTQGIGFIQTKKNCKDFPNIETLFITPSGLNLTIPETGTLNQETVENFSQRLNSQTTMAVTMILLHPKARGMVSLVTNSPFDFPAIDTRFLSEQEDIDAIYRTIQNNLKLIRTEAFQKFNGSLLNYRLPACNNFAYLSKDYWVCTVRQLSASVHHVVGTCKMGPKRDRKAVVDNKLNVHGTGKLRVVDASIMPVIIAGHPNGPIIMIAEKISDVIKDYYHCIK